MKQLRTWAQWRAKWAWALFPITLVGTLVVILGGTLALTAATCDNFDIKHMDRPCSQQP